MKNRQQLIRMLWNKREIARQKELPFNLKVEDLPPIPEFCPALGIPLVVSDSGCSDDYSPSLDRIIPEMGYCKGNVVWVSNLCNRIKSNHNWSDLLKIGKFYNDIAEAVDIPRAQTKEEVIAIRNSPRPQAVPATPDAWVGEMEFRRQAVLKASTEAMEKFILAEIPSFIGQPFKYSDLEVILKEHPIWEIYRELPATVGAKIFSKEMNRLMNGKYIKSKDNIYTVFIT